MQHRIVITEEQISRALNESIDEFMLEEGAIADLSKRAIGKVARGAWNGIKAYMDWRTKGAWNAKYGQYVNGTGKTTEMYYLNKWFAFHLNQIKRISMRGYDPSDVNTTYKIEKNPLTGKEEKTTTVNKYNDIPTYVQENVTARNFNAWIGNFIKDRVALQAIDNYINRYCQSITDVRSAVKSLSTATFMSTKLGQYYLSNKRENQVNKAIKAQTQELEYIAKNMHSYQAWVRTLNTIELKKINQLVQSKGMPNNIKEFISYMVRQHYTDGGQIIAGYITYENFISMYGKMYNPNAIKNVRRYNNVTKGTTTTNNNSLDDDDILTNNAQ